MSKPTNKLVVVDELRFDGLRFKNRTETKGITIHCSASKPSQDWDAVDIDQMHRRQGWLCIGYHFVISRDGRIHLGRPTEARGAHCKNEGRNTTHIGICLVGGVAQNPVGHVPGSPWNGSNAEANFTEAQGESLRTLIDSLCIKYGLTRDDVEGHRDVAGVRKACPSFNVEEWKASGAFQLD